MLPVSAFICFIGGFRSFELPAECTVGERGGATLATSVDNAGLLCSGLGLANITSCGVLSSFIGAGDESAFRRLVRTVSPTFAWPHREANCKEALDSAVDAGEGETVQNLLERRRQRLVEEDERESETCNESGGQTYIKTLLPSRVSDGWLRIGSM